MGGKSNPAKYKSPQVWTSLSCSGKSKEALDTHFPWLLLDRVWHVPGFSPAASSIISSQWPLLVFSSSVLLTCQSTLRFRAWLPLSASTALVMSQAPGFQCLVQMPWTPQSPPPAYSTGRTADTLPSQSAPAMLFSILADGKPILPLCWNVRN